MQYIILEILIGLTVVIAMVGLVKSVFDLIESLKSQKEAVKLIKNEINSDMIKSFIEIIDSERSFWIVENALNAIFSKLPESDRKYINRGFKQPHYSGRSQFTRKLLVRSLYD